MQSYTIQHEAARPGHLTAWPQPCACVLCLISNSNIAGAACSKQQSLATHHGHAQHMRTGIKRYISHKLCLRMSVVTPDLSTRDSGAPWSGSNGLTRRPAYAHCVQWLNNVRKHYDMCRCCSLVGHLLFRVDTYVSFIPPFWAIMLLGHISATTSRLMISTIFEMIYNCMVRCAGPRSAWSSLPRSSLNSCRRP